VYLERRILGALHGSADFDFSAIIGWKALGTHQFSKIRGWPTQVFTDKIAEDAVDLFGKDHEYTKLIIKHEGVDPEDVYSTVAYEKGFHFLWYLDRLVGRDHFDKFIPHYFTTWSMKSLDSFEFKKTFIDFFEGYGNEEIKQKITTIDWDDKFYTPGLPPKPTFDTTLADMCYDLAKKWQDAVCRSQS
jgi:leukotriene-A4 hydrolase